VKIPREFELIAGRGHPRSSILKSIESAYAATSYWTCLLPFSRYWSLKLESVFPPLPCLTPQLRGGLEFLDETYPTSGRGYRTVKLHNPNFNRFRLIDPRDGRIDGREGDSV